MQDDLIRLCGLKVQGWEIAKRRPSILFEPHLHVHTLMLHESLLTPRLLSRQTAIFFLSKICPCRHCSDKKSSLPVFPASQLCVYQRVCCSLPLVAPLFGAIGEAPREPADKFSTRLGGGAARIGRRQGRAAVTNE